MVIFAKLPYIDIYKNIAKSCANM